MSKNGLHRHYDRFTPEERFRLDVLAMARGDERESEKLTNTCPKRSYTMNDYAFVRRWETARELAYLVHMDYGRCQDKIQMIRAFRVVFPYLRTVWENDTLEAYLDGHHAGSRHAWTVVGAGGSRPDGNPTMTKPRTPILRRRVSWIGGLRRWTPRPRRYRTCSTQ